MSVNKLIHFNIVPKNKETYNLVATSEDIQDINESVDHANITSVSTKFDIYKNNANLAVLEGSIEASYSQQCRITLEDINIEDELEFKRVFSNELEKKASNKSKVIDINLESTEEDIDFLSDNNISLMDIVKEELILNINPYITKN